MIVEVVIVEKKDLFLFFMLLGGDLECFKELEELEEWKKMYELNVEKEKIVLEDVVRKRKEEE